jgi:DNA-binding NarL/FixJ family response regulator
VTTPKAAERRSNAPGAPAVGRLSTRERAVLQCLARGRRNDEIGHDLGISQHTVRTHVQNILGKLEVSNRHAAVALARRSGVPLDDGIGA